MSVILQKYMLFMLYLGLNFASEPNFCKLKFVSIYQDTFGNNLSQERVANYWLVDSALK